MMYNQGHMTPNASNASPHPHEDFEMGSPTNWPRTPASPVFNTHIAAPPPPPETSSYRSSKVKVNENSKIYRIIFNIQLFVFRNPIVWRNYMTWMTIQNEEFSLTSC